MPCTECSPGRSHGWSNLLGIGPESIAFSFLAILESSVLIARVISPRFASAGLAIYRSADVRESDVLRPSDGILI
jgi:hypothetical protein